MSDQTPELYPLVLAHLRQHSAVTSLFPANRVRVFEIVPDNIQGLYIVLNVEDFSPIIGDRLRAGESEFAVRVWSKTDPPSKAEAMQAGAAVVDAMLALSGAGDIEVKSVSYDRSQYLLQPDNATVQGILTFSVTSEAA